MRIAVMLRAIAEDQGTGIYTRNLVEKLLALDHEDDFFLIHRDHRHGLGFEEHPNVHELCVSAPGKLLWDQSAVTRVAAREHVDLLFSPKFTAPLLAPCPTVISLHGSEWFTHPERYKRLDVAYVRLLTPLYCHRADAILSNSELTTRDFVRLLKVPAAKIVTIPFAAHPIFRPVTDEAERERVRRRYGLPPRFLLFVGKIYPGKNLGGLFEAFARLTSAYPDLGLVVVGDTRWAYESDFARVAALGITGRVLFTGWVPQGDLPAIYSQAELFVFPSFYEGFGIPAVEAMATGCPAAVAATGALPEVTGGAAELFDPADPADMADKIAALLASPEHRAELRQRGIIRARDFSWDKAAAATLDVFRRVARGEDPKPRPAPSPPANGFHRAA